MNNGKYGYQNHTGGLGFENVLFNMFLKLLNVIFDKMYA